MGGTLRPGCVSDAVLANRNILGLESDRTAGSRVDLAMVRTNEYALFAMRDRFTAQQSALASASERVTNLTLLTPRMGSHTDVLPT